MLSTVSTSSVPKIANRPSDTTPFVEIGKEHRLMHFFEKSGAAVGGAIGAAAGSVDRFVRGAAHSVGTPEMKQAVSFGARAGLVAGLAAGVLAGASVGGPIGAVIGGIACGLVGTCVGAVGGGAVAAVSAGAADVPEGARTGWSRGYDVGMNAAIGTVRAETLSLIWLGDHSKTLHSIGLFFMRLGQTEPVGDDFQRVHQVDGAVWRSAQPGPKVWDTLAAQGFKSVVNLRWEKNYEEDAVKAAGLKTLYLQESPLKAPTIEQALDFLKFVTDPTNQPVLFHCYSGVDRTGTMAACYRIAVQGWTQDAALKEALELGMVPELQADKIRFIKQFNAAWLDMQAKGTAPHFGP